MSEAGPLDAPATITGVWVTLEAISNLNAAEVAEVDARRQFVPEMGGPYVRQRLKGRFGPGMAIRENKSGQIIGTVENDEMAGYPGVAVYIIYADPDRSRPGFGMEASGLYIPTLFDRGADIMHLEILSFNREMTHLLDRRHRPPDVRMRRHAYVAGHYWDVLIYGFDRDDWEAFFAKFRAVLPGGSRAIAALGSGR